MEANELRISNLVTDLDGDVMPISEITKDYVSFSGCNLKSRYGKIKPVPLTEDWLIRFGFEKYDNHFDFRFKGFCISFYLYETGKIIECYLESVGLDVIYVHQLQNLYFALTGLELTLKN